jgi:RNA polymerase sigma-70 factor (ECF subfamily)
MSRLHRGRRQLRELLTEYAKERGFLRPPRVTAAAATAGEALPVGVAGGGAAGDDANVGDERREGRGDGLR